MAALSNGSVRPVVVTGEVYRVSFQTGQSKFRLGEYRPHSPRGNSGASPRPPRSLTRGGPESPARFARAWWGDSQIRLSTIRARTARPRWHGAGQAPPPECWRRGSGQSAPSKNGKGRIGIASAPRYGMRRCQRLPKLTHPVDPVRPSNTSSNLVPLTNACFVGQKVAWLSCLDPPASCSGHADDLLRGLPDQAAGVTVLTRNLPG